MKKTAMAVIAIVAVLATICAIVYRCSEKEMLVDRRAVPSSRLPADLPSPSARPEPSTVVPVAEPIAPPPLSNPAAAAVRVMLEGATPDDWEPALTALVETADADVVAALAAALATETDAHRLQLIGRALNGIGTAESFRIFRNFLSDEKNLGYREHMAGTMLALENAELSGQVLDWMMEMQRVMDYDITMACQEAVGRLATEETLARIVAEHGRTNCNEYALELMRTSLANSECPEAIDLFRNVLEHPEGRPTPDLQAAVAQALARIGTRPAIDALIAALEESTRSPENDYLADAVLLLQRSYLQAYLQEQFDRATAPNVKYALGRVLAETVPLLGDDSEEPPPGTDGLPIPPEEEAHAAVLGIEPSAGAGGEGAEEPDSTLIPSGAVPPEAVPAGVD